MIMHKKNTSKTIKDSKICSICSFSLTELMTSINTNLFIIQNMRKNVILFISRTCNNKLDLASRFALQSLSNKDFHRQINGLSIKNKECFEYKYSQMAKICYRITKQQFQITRCHKLDVNSPFHSFIWFPK